MKIFRRRQRQERQAGRIEIRSDAFASTGFSPTPECRINIPPREYPLRLITPHSKYQVNSQNADLSWKNTLERPILEMNHQDAKTRGLRDGDRISMVSSVGVMQIRVRLTPDIVPGTVCLHQGVWTVRDAGGVETGGAANMLEALLSIGAVELVCDPSSGDA